MFGEFTVLWRFGERRTCFRFTEGQFHFGIVALYEPKQATLHSNPNTVLSEHAGSQTISRKKMTDFECRTTDGKL